MTVGDSVTQWISELKDGDESAAQRLWDKYFRRLAKIAEKRLKNIARLPADGEDVALSAFHSFCEGINAGRFDDLNDRDSLWKLMVAITVRKASHTVRDEFRQKRGGGKVVGESAITPHAIDYEEMGRLDLILDEEPTPEFVVQFEEVVNALFEQLPDEELKQIAAWKMQGFTSTEIADRLGKALSTVERRLKLIRSFWADAKPV